MAHAETLTGFKWIVRFRRAAWRWATRRRSATPSVGSSATRTALAPRSWWPRQQEAAYAGLEPARPPRRPVPAVRRARDRGQERWRRPRRSQRRQMRRLCAPGCGRAGAPRRWPGAVWSTSRTCPRGSGSGGRRARGGAGGGRMGGPGAGVGSGWLCVPAAPSIPEGLHGGRGRGGHRWAAATASHHATLDERGARTRCWRSRPHDDGRCAGAAQLAARIDHTLLVPGGYRRRGGGPVRRGGGAGGGHGVRVGVHGGRGGSSVPMVVGVSAVVTSTGAHRVAVKVAEAEASPNRPQVSNVVIDLATSTRRAVDSGDRGAGGAARWVPAPVVTKAIVEAGLWTVEEFTVACRGRRSGGLRLREDIHIRCRWGRVRGRPDHGGLGGRSGWA